MPLRDHFRPPFGEIRSWGEFHGMWPAEIVLQLGKMLPPRYTAGPRVHLGAEVEIDVATFESEPVAGAFHARADDGGVAAAVWAPAEPTLAVQTELSDFDEYELRVYDTLRGRRLVAAVELISPANKDRPEHCSQFTSKCAALLRQGVSLVLVDVGRNSCLSESDDGWANSPSISRFGRAARSSTWNSGMDWTYD